MKTSLLLAIVALLALAAIPAHAFDIDGSFNAAQFPLSAAKHSALTPYGVAAVAVSDGTPLVHGVIAWDHLDCVNHPVKTWFVPPQSPSNSTPPVEVDPMVQVVIYDATTRYYLGVMSTQVTPFEPAGYQQVTLVPEPAPIPINQPGDVIEALNLSFGCKSGHIAFSATP